MPSWKDQPLHLPITAGHRLSRPVRKFFAVFATALLLGGGTAALAQDQAMMVRMSEIEVDAKYLDQYRAILREEAEASVRLEPGVIAIFPMYQREKETGVSILELYASREAYEAHLKTPHFQKYKSETRHMVKSLKLVDMQALDAATMTTMFKKLQDDRQPKAR
ncbi:MAG: antibiotic biosynthesis monooxygenase [Duganella sp.]